MQKKDIFAQKNIFFFVEHTLKFLLKLRRIAYQKKAKSLEAAIGSPPFGLKGFSPLFCRTVFQYCDVRDKTKSPWGPADGVLETCRAKKIFFFVRVAPGYHKD